MEERKAAGLELGAMPGGRQGGEAWRWLGHGGGGGVELAWRWIPPGRFRMGARGYYADEEPVHEVEVREGFWMLETPVTQAQWVWMEVGENPSFFQGSAEWRELPVERVKWAMARRWCARLEERMREEGEKVWRADLPSEAEWEYACRAGSAGEYWNGDGEERLEEVGWYAGNSKGRTHAVREKGRKNGWGLYDMHGNVWEWCRDAWDAAAYEKREDGWFADVTEEEDESWPRAMRGGSFADHAVYCRSACRNWWLPGREDCDGGFRACLFPGPKQPARKNG